MLEIPVLSWVWKKEITNPEIPFRLEHGVYILLSTLPEAGVKIPAGFSGSFSWTVVSNVLFFPVWFKSGSFVTETGTRERAAGSMISFLENEELLHVCRLVFAWKRVRRPQEKQVHVLNPLRGTSSDVCTKQQCRGIS